MLTCDDYLTPGSLDEAFDMMASNRGCYRIIAGATDALPWAREGRAGDVHIPALIDVAKIPELCELSIGDKRARRRTRSLGRLECRQLVRRRANRVD
jgi:carbon-monoxide dehydrogenase medium subunit/xanthine dehydrogenase FAD-binding subunit